VRKLLVSPSHVVIHPKGKECSQALALSLSEKKNNRSQNASVQTPLTFDVSHTSKKTERCRFRSSKGVPPNWDCCTMKMRAGLSLKLFASILGRVMLEVIPWIPEVTKSLSILLWLRHPAAIFVEVLLASRLCSSIFWSFLRKRKVLSISRSGSYRNGLRINGKDSYKHYHQYYQHNQT